MRRPEAEWPVKSEVKLRDFKEKHSRRWSPELSQRRILTQTRKSMAQTIVSSEDGTSAEPQKTVKTQGLGQVVEEPKRMAWGAALVSLVKPEPFSTLSRLCGGTAWVRCAVETWMSKKTQALDQAQGEATVSDVRQKRLVQTMQEWSSAFQDLALAAQDGENFQDSTLNRLVIAKDKETGLLLSGGRIQSWSEDGKAVPLLPFQAWLGTLLA